MLRKLQDLDPEDYQTLVNALPMIAVLIGSANEGYIEEKEIEASKRIAIIRSHSFDADLKEFYADVARDFTEKIQDIIDVTPRDKEQRQTFLSDELSKVTPVLSMLQEDLAVRLHASMKSFGYHTAQSSGGFLDYLSISPEEQALVDLEMIEFKSRI
jgi:protein gp37